MIRALAGGVAVSVMMASSAVAATVPANDFEADLPMADRVHEMRQLASEDQSAGAMASVAGDLLRLGGMLTDWPKSSREPQVEKIYVEYPPMNDISVVPLPAAGWLLLGGLGGLAALRRRKG